MSCVARKTPGLTQQGGKLEGFQGRPSGCGAPCRRSAGALSSASSAPPPPGPPTERLAGPGLGPPAADGLTEPPSHTPVALTQVLLQPLCPEAVFQTQTGPVTGPARLLNLRRNTFDCFRPEGPGPHLSGLLCWNKAHRMCGSGAGGLVSSNNSMSGRTPAGLGHTRLTPARGATFIQVRYIPDEHVGECGPRGPGPGGVARPGWAATSVPGAVPWDSGARPWEQGPGRLPSSAGCSVCAQLVPTFWPRAGRSLQGAGAGVTPGSRAGLLSPGNYGAGSLCWGVSWASWGADGQPPWLLGAGCQ